MAARTIFHVDVNSAFLSWSALKKLEEEPGSVDLRTIPSAVGGDISTRHGIITAKSIPAKRFGIVTGEPVVKALQKCPQLVLVRSDFETYRRMSAAFIDILRKYTPVVEQVSIDEAYMDMTEEVAAEAAQSMEAALSGEGALPGEATASGEALDTARRREAALAIAHRLRNEIRDTLKFTVNVGISENKLLAKTASDFSKPDKVHTLYPEEVPAKLWPLPIRELHGCGAATSGKLTDVGVRTIGDAAAMSRTYLQTLLGRKAGDYIWHSANGRSESPVNPQTQEAKSYSNEVTTAIDITAGNYEKEAPEILARLASKVAGRLKRDGVRAATIGVQVKTSAFRRHSRQQTLSVATSDADVIGEMSRRLLEGLLLGDDGLFAQGAGIRLIGVSASGLDTSAYRQMDLFSWAREREEKPQQQEASEGQQEEKPQQQKASEGQWEEKPRHRQPEEPQRQQTEEKQRQPEELQQQLQPEEELQRKREEKPQVKELPARHSADTPPGHSAETPAGDIQETPARHSAETPAGQPQERQQRTGSRDRSLEEMLRKVERRYGSAALSKGTGALTKKQGRRKP